MYSPRASCSPSTSRTQCGALHRSLEWSRFKPGGAAARLGSSVPQPKAAAQKGAKPAPNAQRKAGYGQAAHPMRRMCAVVGETGNPGRAARNRVRSCIGSASGLPWTTGQNNEAATIKRSPAAPVLAWELPGSPRSKGFARVDNRNGCMQRDYTSMHHWRLSPVHLWLALPTAPCPALPQPLCALAHPGPTVPCPPHPTGAPTPICTPPNPEPSIPVPC